MQLLSHSRGNDYFQRRDIISVVRDSFSQTAGRNGMPRRRDAVAKQAEAWARPRCERPVRRHRGHGSFAEVTGRARPRRPETTLPSIGLEETFERRLPVRKWPHRPPRYCSSHRLAAGSATAQFCHAGRGQLCRRPTTAAESRLSSASASLCGWAARTSRAASCEGISFDLERRVDVVDMEPSAGSANLRQRAA